MLTSIYVLKKNLREIGDYIVGIEAYNRLISYNIKKKKLSDSEKAILDFKNYNSNLNKKLFDYKTIIISLYGALEYFIEGLIKEYLDYLCQVVKEYKDLPQKIQDNHFELSADLIKNLKLQKYQNILSKESIIINLNSCINGSNYKLNTEAYTYHSSNFRHDSINDFFSKVGIEGISNKTKEVQSFEQYLVQQFPGIPISQIPDTKVFEKITDLANRRNEISHGNQSEILSNMILIEYICFIENYCDALNQIIFELILPFEIEDKAIPLMPINIFNNRIICVNLKNKSIKVNDMLIAKTNDTKHKYLYGKIKQLQVNNVSVDSIDSQQSIDVGIETDFNIKQNQEFYYISQ